MTTATSTDAFSPELLAWKSRGRRIAVGDVDVFVIDSGAVGEGVPLVLLHGFPTASIDWRVCFEAWSAHRRVIALDMPGYGLSDKPAGWGYSLFQQAEVIERVLKSLGVPRTHLCVHDMATSVTTELLARRDAGLLSFEIDSVSFLNGSVFIEMAHLTPSQQLLLRPWLAPLVVGLQNPTVFRLQLRRLLGRPGAVADAVLDDLFALLRHRQGFERLPETIGYIRDRRRFAARWTRALTRFERPALVLWGARDPVAVKAIGDRLAVTLPNATKHTLDDVGHFPMLEAPERVIELVAAFWERVDAGPPVGMPKPA